MTKATQLWPGERMRAFFVAHIRRETSLDDAAAAKLAAALSKAVNRLFVWEMPTERLPPLPAPGGNKLSKSGDRGLKASGPGAANGTAATTASVAVSASADAPFDPYAFSAMVVLAKTGRDGLAKRLAEIRSSDQLLKLADAQHLGIDRTLTRVDDLRKAIVTAAEQRLADRRAAAS
ncbi:MAG: hypothetical protein ACRCS9_00930 [Hyphomicrobium sp.]